MRKRSPPTSWKRRGLPHKEPLRNFLISKLRSRSLIGETQWSRHGRGCRSTSDARAARAGLENLARTLSIEWSRHAITTVAIAPAPDTDAGELAALCAYLASPAGAYFSGCLLAPGALGR